MDPKDVEQFNRQITCPVCLDKFENPKVLPCGHSFCSDPCMKSLLNHRSEELQCPECRKTHRIPSNPNSGISLGVNAFPDNYGLKGMLEFNLKTKGNRVYQKKCTQN